MRGFSWIFGALGAACLGSCAPSNAQSVAVFDPQTRFDGRFVMSPDAQNRVAQTLENAGLPVVRVSSAQIEDATLFNAQKTPVLLLKGDSVPRENIPELQKWAREGGVLVALDARNPFVIAAAQRPNGAWTYSPETPNFAWETREITDLFGFRYLYQPGLFDSGTNHQITPLWKRYVPSAQNVEGALPSSWLATLEGGQMFPLVQSTRADGKNVTPQVFIARRDGCVGVFSTSKSWSDEDGEIVGLARLALDLNARKIAFEGLPSVQIPSEMAPLAPLSTRRPIGAVEPENAPVKQRWGRFDGSGAELGSNTGLPPVLEAGKIVQLRLDAPLRGENWLRLRGAFGQSGANLRVSGGEQTLWNETFSFFDAGGAGNTFASDLKGKAIEWTRRVFLPGGTSSLVLQNTGTAPLYFDAVQVEGPLPRPISWNIGMNGGFNQTRFTGPYNLPTSEMEKWHSVRVGLWASSVKGPEDYAAIDERMARFTAIPSRLELILEGTSAYTAISPQRFQEAGNRSHTTAPDPQKFAAIADYVSKKYGDKIDKYEIWNEANSPQFYRGTPQEYLALWKTLVPILRRNDPTAQIITSGLAGWKDPFVDALIEGGALKEADLFGFHPYASKAPAWDLTFGEAQGNLYARGQNIEIYNNEVGFTHVPGEWFVGNFNETTQRQLTDIALSRLLASGGAKVSIFHAGGDDHLYGYIRPDGTPRPAYRVLEDYFPLAQSGGVRLDANLSRQDGLALTGVYLAGARHSDGSATLVVNPSELTAQSEVVPQTISFADAAWKPFFGTARRNGDTGQTTLALEKEREYVGLGGPKLSVDLARNPILQLKVGALGGRFELALRAEDGEQHIVLKGDKPGVFQVDLREVFPREQKLERTPTLRAFGGGTFEGLELLPPPNARPAAFSIPVKLQVPGAFRQATIQPFGGAARTIALKQNAGWCEVELDLGARTTLRLVR